MEQIWRKLVSPNVRKNETEFDGDIAPDIGKFKLLLGQSGRMIVSAKRETKEVIEMLQNKID